MEEITLTITRTDLIGKSMAQDYGGGFNIAEVQEARKHNINLTDGTWSLKEVIYGLVDRGGNNIRQPNCNVDGYEITITKPQNICQNT